MSFSRQTTASIAPGRYRSIGISVSNLMAGDWQVTAQAIRLTAPGTCPNRDFPQVIRVQPGGFRIIRIDFADAPGVFPRCE
jgi:hypothetical protein